VNLIVKTPHARDVKMYEEYEWNSFKIHWLFSAGGARREQTTELWQK